MVFSVFLQCKILLRIGTCLSPVTRTRRPNNNRLDPIARTVCSSRLNVRSTCARHCRFTSPHRRVRDFNRQRPTGALYLMFYSCLTEFINFRPPHREDMYSYNMLLRLLRPASLIYDFQTKQYHQSLFLLSNTTIL